MELVEGKGGRSYPDVITSVRHGEGYVGACHMEGVMDQCWSEGLWPLIQGRLPPAFSWPGPQRRTG